MAVRAVCSSVLSATFILFFVMNGQFLIFLFAFFSFSVCAMTDFHDKKFLVLLILLV